MIYRISCSSLSNQVQYVTYSSLKSTTKILKCGVLQGSVLGLLLFLMYINDSCQMSEFCLPLVFANDTHFLLQIMIQ